MATPALNSSTLPYYLQYSIQAPPPGVTPNFVNPPSSAYQVYITAGVCIMLILAFTTIRCISKFSLGYKIVVVEEIVFWFGVVLCLAFIAMTIACVSGGAFGRDAWNVLLGAFTKSQLVLSLMVETVLPIATFFVKTSVLLLYLELFGVMRWMKIASIVSIVLIGCWYLSLTIAYGVMCSPRNGYSQVDLLAAFISDTCSETRILVVLQGVGNVVTDLWLILLPLPAVWTLQMPLRRKIAITFMFLVGLSACIASIVGLYYRTKFYSAGSNNTRLVVPSWATSMAEEAAGVMICCMPPIVPVVRKVKALDWSRLSSYGSRTGGKSQPDSVALRYMDDGSQSRVSKESREDQNSIQSEGPRTWRPESRDRHAAWAHVSRSEQSLRQFPLSEHHIGRRRR